MKTNSFISFTIITFSLFIGGVALASFSEPTSSAPSANTYTAIDTSSIHQSSPNALAFTALLSGYSGYIAIDTVGRVGVNKVAPDVDVRLSVDGSIRSDYLIGTGIGRVCTSDIDANSSVTIIRC